MGDATERARELVERISAEIGWSQRVLSTRVEAQKALDALVAELVAERDAREEAERQTGAAMMMFAEAEARRVAELQTRLKELDDRNKWRWPMERARADEAEAQYVDVERIAADDRNSDALVGNAFRHALRAVLAVRDEPASKETP